MSPGPSTTRRDILSAYGASFARIASWAAVSAVVYRRCGVYDFALLALIRATIGILNYASLGLGPALIHHLAKFHPTPPDDPDRRSQPLFYAGFVAATLIACAALVPLIVFSRDPSRWLRDTVGLQDASTFILTFGIGVLLKIVSDAPGAVLQSRERIAFDNTFQAAADLLWAALTAAFVWPKSGLAPVGMAYCVASTCLLITRLFAAERRILLFGPRLLPTWHDVTTLLSFGLLVTLAQLADYLYAPTDFLLINHFLPPADLAAYAPCVQIDAALLVLVTGLSTVLLPKAALAHARQDVRTLRRYYVQGTLLSTAMLLGAALVTWLAAPLLLRLWLHDVPPGTLAVLPLVLCHTVIGGSSAVGRSILLGAGRVRPFTAAVLITGGMNVLVSYLLVRYTSLGLTGIVLGTVLAVTGRCAVWMPWYVLRTLRRMAALGDVGESEVIASQTPVV